MDHLDLRDPDRIRRHSPPAINAQIDLELRQRAAGSSGEQVIAQRLGELNREWEVDRALMAVFPVLGGLSFGLGLSRARRHPRRFNGWFTLLGVQMGFMMLHALVGWCPPVAALRRLGFRSAREIEAERHALIHGHA